MNTLNFPDNIVRLRRQKKITQEELADFIGVTKASVSKWETGQSMPDIMILPKLASFFDVSIDALIGYDPQLSREQIQKIYLELAADFAGKPFDEVMERSRGLVKKYYSCYPFLFQICVLWINHFMLAETEESQQEILEQASKLCGRILGECKNIGICNDTALLKATIDMQRGKAAEVIEILEELINPLRLAGQSDTILIRAYQMAGDTGKADSFAQISMFLHLMNLVSDAVEALSVKGDNLEFCEETIRRIDCVAEAFGLERLQPSAVILFYYQAAIVYCRHQKEQEALKRLKRCVLDIRHMLTGDNLIHHGDRYFDRISQWYEQLDLGVNAPRDKKVICDSALQVLAHPAFSVFAGNPEFEQLCILLEELRETI